MLGRLALNLETWDRRLNLHPGILDGAMQLLLLACPSSLRCFLPFTIDSCIIATEFPCCEFLVTVHVRSVSAESISGNVEICTEDGILVARLMSLTCRAQPESKQEELTQLMYRVAFLTVEKPSYALPESTTALVYCSVHRKQQVLAALSWKEEQCRCFTDSSPSVLQSALDLLSSLECSQCTLVLCRNLSMHHLVRLWRSWLRCLCGGGQSARISPRCLAVLAGGIQVESHNHPGGIRCSAARA